MRASLRNVVATVLVALVVLPYLGYLLADAMPFIEDPRGMAATGLVLGMVAVLVPGREVFTPGPWHRAALVSGAIAFGLGIAALRAETNETLLALFIAAIVLTWALGEFVARRGEHHDRRLVARDG